MAHLPDAVEEKTFDVGRDDEVPVGVHLAWRLRALIVSGHLGAGEKLPGVRELAAGAGVNVNTARAIYRRLEEEQLVVSRHGQGTFVAADVAVSPELEQVAADAAEAARALGIDPRELARTLYAGSAPGAPPPNEPVALTDPEAALAEPGEDEARAARRALRAQIARLEAQLAAYPADAAKAGIAEAAPEPLAGPAARIAGIGELEAVRDQLVDRLKRVRGQVELRERDQQEARRHLGRMVEDPESHKWEAVSNEEMGDPGCSSYRVAPVWGPVGALMSWWRVRVSGGCPLAAPLEAAQGANGSFSRR